MRQNRQNEELSDPHDFGVLPDARGGDQAGSDDESEDAARAPDGSGEGGPGGDSEKLSRIRDLLFGEAARDHSRRLDSVEDSLSAALAGAEERLKDQLEAAAAAADVARSKMKEEFDSEVARLESALASTQAELRSAQAALDTQARGKVERSDFASMLGELARRVGEAGSEDDS